MSVTSVSSVSLRAASVSSLKKMMAVRLREAGEVIAAATRAKAAMFSKRIPASVKVSGTANAVFVIAGGEAAPNAYPFETGARHPLFGNTNFWYAQPKRPFLEEAAEASASAAAGVFAQVLDDWCDALL